MITDQDVEKLKQFFATKDDLNRFVTKKQFDIVADTIASEFIGLVEMIGAMNKQLVERMNRVEQRFRKYDALHKEADEKFDMMQERFERHDQKFYRLLEKLNEQQSNILGHEKRFQRIEAKLFPTP